MENKMEEGKQTEKSSKVPGAGSLLPIGPRVLKKTNTLPIAYDF